MNTKNHKSLQQHILAPRHSLNSKATDTRKHLPKPFRNDSSTAKDQPDARTTLSRWKEINPQITQHELALLSGAGDIPLKIHALPLHLVIYIADFVYPSDAREKNRRSKPLEWLILSAVYRQIIPRITNDAALQLSGHKEYIRLLFQRTSKTNSTNSNSHQTTVTSQEEELLEDTIRKSEHAVVVTAMRIAYRLTDENHQLQLALVALAGTYAQKTATLLYLLEALQTEYWICKQNHPQGNEEYLKAYNSTQQYVAFIEKYYEPWLQELKNTKPKEGTVEADLIRDYPRYLSCANETLRKCQPPGAVKSQQNRHDQTESSQPAKLGSRRKNPSLQQPSTNTQHESGWFSFLFRKKGPENLPTKKQAPPTGNTFLSSILSKK